MKIRLAFALLLLVSVLSLAAHTQVGAQGGLALQVQTLSAEVTALTTTVNSLKTQVATLQADDTAAKANVAALQVSVNKLDGDITAADLVGTYSMAGFQTELDPFVATSVPPVQATINSSAYAETFTLNADGTGSGQGTQDGWTLVQGSWSVNPLHGPVGSILNFNWTYSGGVLSIVLPNGDHGAFAVGAGGRVLFSASTNTDHTTSLFIATRLQ